MNKTRILISLFLVSLLPLKVFSEVVCPVKQASQIPEEPQAQTAPGPVIKISQLKTNQSLYSFELREVEVGDLLRVLAYDHNLNMLIEKDVAGKITASLTNISLEEALERIADICNLILEKKGNVIIVKPNLITKVFIVKNVEAKELLVFSQDAKSQTGTIYDLLSPKGKILLGKQMNSLVVIDYPANIKRMEEFLQTADQKMNTSIFKLKYLSVKELFPELIEAERKGRKDERVERGEERCEIKELKAEAGGK